MRSPKALGQGGIRRQFFGGRWRECVPLRISVTDDGFNLNDGVIPDVNIKPTDFTTFLRTF